MAKKTIAMFVLVLLSLTLPAVAADCTAVQRTVSDIVRQYDEVRAKANLQYVICAFKGTDDKGVELLAAALSSVQHQVAKVDTPGIEECLKENGNLQDFLELIGNRAGESFGRTVVGCSEKAQAIRKDTSLPDKEKIAKMTEFIKSYLR